MGCTHEIKNGMVTTIVNVGGALGGCSFCKQAALEKKNEDLREVVEQAVVLYENLHREAIEDGDVQGENFWEGHIATALHALGKLDEAHAVVDRAIGPVRTALLPTDRQGDER